MKKFSIADLILLLFYSASITIITNSCSKYIVKNPGNLVSQTNNVELIFENIYWEVTDNLQINMINIPYEFNKVYATDIKSITVKKNGFEIPAGYLDWGRNGEYKFEIINFRIVLYWRLKESESPGTDPVTIIVRLE